MLREVPTGTGCSRGLGFRRRGAVAFALLMALLCAGGSALADAPSARPDDESLDGREVVPGEVIVRYERGAAGSDRTAAMDTVDASHERDLLLPRTELVEVEPGEEDEAAAALEQDPTSTTPSRTESSTRQPRRTTPDSASCGG